MKQSSKDLVSAQIHIPAIFASFIIIFNDIKQIMTGLQADLFAPRDSGSPPPRSIGTLGEAILNLKGQIDSLLPEVPVIICFILPLCYSKKKMIVLIGSLLVLPWV